MYRKEYQPKNCCNIAAETAGLISAGLSLAGGIGQTTFNAAQTKKQREWSEKMTAQQNAWNLEMWNKANEYNSPAAQVERLREAGLNPLYYGLDGSSTNALESAQPLGYEKAQMGDVSNIGAAGLNAYAQMKALDKEIELKDAQIDEIKNRASGIGIDNHWKTLTMDASAATVSAIQKYNQMSADEKEQFVKIAEQNVKKAREEVRKAIAEANTEEERTGLVMAEKILNEKQAWKIEYLAEYEKLLMQAQTDAQKANAAVSWANAAIQQGLLDNGYVDNMIDEQLANVRKSVAGADLAELEKATQEYKYAIKTGQIFDISKYEGKPVGKALAKLMNATTAIISITSEACGTGLHDGSSITVSKGDQSSQGSSVSNTSVSGSK